MTGWLSVFAWLFTTASAASFCAQLCLGLAAFYHEDYTPEPYQVWLIYTLIIIICAAFVCLLPKLVPITESVFFWASVVGFVVSFIALLAASKVKQPASVVFTGWVNQTGWSDGTAFMLAVGQSMYGFLCTDSATHISEELPNPGRNVPRAMWLTIAIGIATTLPFTLAVLFSIQSFDELSASALPIREIYFQALNSKAGAAFFVFLILFIYFGAVIGLVVTSGRLIWAFARDDGIPFPKVFSKTHPTLQTPVNATLLTAVFCILYGLIYIGSTEAFNSFVATSILSLNITYVIPQAILLIRGRANVLPKRHFDLGAAFGTFCNVFSCAWVALYAVLFCFPIFLPVTAKSMNYVSVVMAGTVLFVVVMWFARGRGRFTGPNIQGLEVLSAVNMGQTGVFSAGRSVSERQEDAEEPRKVEA